jgi:ABC-2 type transport system ATP-binding protein
MKYAIEAKSLTKIYGGTFLAVDSLDMKIKNKSIFGFLGPNGAGKTTTIKMLTCLIQSTKGTATVSGYDINKQPDQVREKIGMVPQLVSLYGDLTAKENISLCADYYGIDKNIKEDRINDLMELVDIKYAENKLIKQMSGGQKQKVSVVASLIHKPEILFLDEPTVGLDPTTKMVLWDLIEELNETGHTIILCSHDMYEVDKLCENIGIMNQGNLVAFDTPQALKDNMMRQTAEKTQSAINGTITEDLDASDEITDPMTIKKIPTTELSIMIKNLSDEIVDEIRNLSYIQNLKLSGKERVTVEIDRFSHEEAINEVIAIVLQHNALITSIYTNDPSLEDVFVNATTRSSSKSA